ncbi:hypothetical protein [Congregibacter litoralis]|uniref:Uncharacterized protein n=1 Tax=Congregibacter litoralis KT71 TaxID=314285 RepID=A4A3S2_9GAMM|nr:hypothetical protein [Congregibacter litoralis]EAQ99345.2 hypothetical protein KT71_16786 [Congregibacter litoralis KT71]
MTNTRRLLSLLLLVVAISLPSGEVYAKDSVSEFGSTLCRRMSKANVTGKNIVQVMKDVLLQYTGISKSDPDYMDQIIAFYNENQNEFICRGKVDSTTRESEHIFKRAAALSIHSKVLYGFFLNNEHTQVNAVEYLVPDPDAPDYSTSIAKLIHAPWGTGEPETFLDYLDKVLADPEADKRYVVSDIKALREMLIDYFGAKTADELIAEGKLQP